MEFINTFNGERFELDEILEIVNANFNVNLVVKDEPLDSIEDDEHYH
jgi:hypothetical protein